MQARVGSFTHDVETGDIGLGAAVGDYPAAGVMGRRDYRYGFCRDVDAIFETTGVDRRKVGFDEIEPD